MKRFFRSSRQADRHGVVLIVVLVLVVMIALAGFGFLAEMTTEYEAARINGDLLQGQQMLFSAESYLLTICEQRAKFPAQVPRLQNAPHLFQAKTLTFTDLPTANADGLSEASENRSTDFDIMWRFAVVADMPDVDLAAAADSGLEQLSSEFDETNLQNSPIQFGLQNESSRLHLATVLQWDFEEPGRGRRALLQIPGMTDEAADGILDWIDADDDVREFGAESEYYLRLDRPYRVRNSVPESLEELLFVKGVSRTAFYGSGRSEVQTGDASTDQTEADGWHQHLTVVSAERNSDSSGEMRLRLNGDTAAVTASDLQELESRLQAFLPEDVARYVVLARLFGISFSTSPGVPPLTISTNSPELRSHASASPSLPITNLSDLVDSSVQLPPSVGGQLVNSPLRSDEPSSLATFALLEDRLTTESTDVVTGRININHASEAVLRALIDDPAAAWQLVRQRESIDQAERQSTLWLLTRQIVDLPTYRRIYRHLTTGGNVHTGEIIVYRPVGGPVLRRKVTIDAANESPRRLDWLDRSELGLSLSIGRLETAVAEF